MDEVSGRDAFDLGLMLEGAPQTPEEKLAVAKRKQQYEKTAYALGGNFSTDERVQLDDEVKRLEASVKKIARREGGQRGGGVLPVPRSTRASERSIPRSRSTAGRSTPSPTGWR